jgi:hypothetical protein
MSRSLIAASLVLMASGAMASTASADVRSCVTINGQRSCSQGQHSVVQTVINGKTVTIVDGKATSGTTDDTTNTVIQSIKPAQPDAGRDDGDDPDQDSSDD